MVLNFVLAFIVLFCVGILALYQLYCLAKNQTNIEAWERGKVESLVKRGKIPPVKKKSRNLSPDFLKTYTQKKNRFVILSILEYTKIYVTYWVLVHYSGCGLKKFKETD